MAQERSLDELRLALAPTIARSAAFDGWSDEALIQAAGAQGVDLAVARLAFPGGAMDMIDAWIASTDKAMAENFSGGLLATMKIRDRIRSLILFRLDAVAGLEESLRRALAIEAMPQNLARSLGFGWRSADAMWRLAGDTATDYNHYTKRATLSLIGGSTGSCSSKRPRPGCWPRANISTWPVSWEGFAIPRVNRLLRTSCN